MITEIAVSKGKARICFDGVCRLTVRAKDLDLCMIHQDDEIEPDECVNKLAAVQFNACYEAALCILDVSAQTRMSMVRKLKTKGFVDPVCDAVADKLSESGLIDEERYAERIAAAEKSKAVGIHSVRRKMLSKGLNEDLIDAATECFDEQQQMIACRKAVIPLMRRYRDVDPREARHKILQALTRKGFSWDISTEALSSVLAEED